MVWSALVSKPKAVLISDVHYSMATLELADKAVNMATDKARELEVPLIVAGDLHDTKAQLRAECVNAMINTFSSDVETYVIVGNHCKINEKSEAHSLEFLRPYVFIIDGKTKLGGLSSDYAHGMYLLPYHSNAEEIGNLLKGLSRRNTKGAILICHQGVLGSNMGHYVQDKSAVPKEAFAGFRTISGHYHARQDIECGPIRSRGVGLFSYIGNPYTLNFGEANDPPKGFQVLYEDGSLEFIPTNLRKHVVIDRQVADLYDSLPIYNHEDLIWLKIRGLPSELQLLKKTEVGQRLFGHSNFKFDLMPNEQQAVVIQEEKQTDYEIMDQVIDNSGESANQKAYLKSLWREVYENS